MSPTLLYAIPSWGMGHFNAVERIQSDFFKQMLLVPVCTPAYLLRLEPGLNHLGVKALDLSINWIVKILRMNGERLTLVCWRRLVWLLDKGSNKIEYNWASRLLSILEMVDFGFLINCFDADIWLSHKEAIVNKFSDIMKNNDLQRYQASASLQIKIPRQELVRPARYITLRCPIALTRIVAQIRLANIYSSRFFVNNTIHKLDMRNPCKLCYAELESSPHILIDCPFYYEIRRKFFNDLLIDKHKSDIIPNLLDIKNPRELKRLALYWLEALEFRDKYLSDDW